MNTYGLRSINAYTFNGADKTHVSHRPCQGCVYEEISIKEAGYISTENCAYDVWRMPAKVRNYINTLLRINNLIFNVLGYFPGIKEISGLIRMGIGFSIIVVTLEIGTPTVGPGYIVGQWYDEALLTGVAQIFRGSMEALTSYGSVVNGCLDILNTVSNIKAEHHFDPSQHPHHHPDPSYWLPFQFLRLV